MFEIKDRLVIITGAAQGMGKEFSRILLKSGAKVCISDIDEIKGNETKALFQQHFGLDDSGVCFVKCNVSKKEDWPKLWDTAEILLKGNEENNIPVRYFGETIDLTSIEGSCSNFG